MRCFSVIVNDAIGISNDIIKETSVQFNIDVREVAAAHFDVASVVAQFFPATEFYPHRAVFSGAVNGAITEGSFGRVEFHWCQIGWVLSGLVVGAAKLVVNSEESVVFPHFIKRVRRGENHHANRMFGVVKRVVFEDGYGMKSVFPVW